MFFVKAKQVIEEARYATRACRHTLVPYIIQPNKDCVVLQTMGKVGSSTVWRSLQESQLARDKNLYRMHFISKKGTQLFRAVHERGYGEWRNFPPMIKGMVMKEKIKANFFRWRFARGDRCKVVCMVRDPIATNVASFFQNYLWWPRGILEACRNRSADCLSALSLCFRESYPHEYPLHWYDWELGGTHGINASFEPFPRSSGWKIFRQPHADVLVIRLDRLNICAREAFCSLTSVENFQIVNENVSDNKWYSDIYKEFVGTIRLNQAYVEKMYGSDWVRYFYSDEEISSFKEKWMD